VGGGTRALATRAHLCVLSATVNNATELGDWLRSVRGPPTWWSSGTGPSRSGTISPSIRARTRRPRSSPSSTARARPRRGSGSTMRLAGRCVAQSGQWYGHRSQGPRCRSRARAHRAAGVARRRVAPAGHRVHSSAAPPATTPSARCSETACAWLAGPNAAPSAPSPAHVTELSDEDLTVLGYDEWLEGLEAGWPRTRRHGPGVSRGGRACFSAGLLKAVLPRDPVARDQHAGRTVVIERFTSSAGPAAPHSRRGSTPS